MAGEYASRCGYSGSVMGCDDGGEHPLAESEAPMLLIFGTRLSEAVINVVRFVCAYCGADAAQNVVKRTNRFTLFFVPLFPVSTKYHNECSNCGGQTELTSAQAQHSLEWARSR